MNKNAMTSSSVVTGYDYSAVEEHAAQASPAATHYPRCLVILAILRRGPHKAGPWPEVR
jgi:hypothetical protein